MASAWRRDEARGKESLMLAYRNADVFELNLRARTYKIGQGELGDVISDREGIEYRVGEQVVARRNDHGRGVINGIQATVRGSGLAPGSLRVERDDGVAQEWDAAYVDAHVRWCYAITIHNSQGANCDTTHTLTDPDSIRRELAYVAMSRGRESNRLYISTGTPAADLDQEHLRDAPDLYDAPEDSVTRFCRQLGESMAKETATEAVSPSRGHTLSPPAHRERAPDAVPTVG